jgi:hypothetical protein
LTIIIINKERETSSSEPYYLSSAFSIVRFVRVYLHF